MRHASDQSRLRRTVEYDRTNLEPRLELRLMIAIVQFPNGPQIPPCEAAYDPGCWIHWGWICSQEGLVQKIQSFVMRRHAKGCHQPGPLQKLTTFMVGVSTSQVRHGRLHHFPTTPQRSAASFRGYNLGNVWPITGPEACQEYVSK